jgi:hypothetical protein
MPQARLRKIYSTAFAVVAVFGALALLAGGATQARGADDASCDFAEPLKQLQELSADYYGDPAFRIRTELTIRKTLLLQIIGCAEREAEAVKRKVEETSAQDTRIAPLRGRSLDILNGALQYYAEARSRVDTLGIGGSKDLAREIRTWRAQTYGPNASQALNFLVWAKNQELFAAAHSRLTDIERAIHALKLTDDETASALFEESVVGLREATAENERARTELERFPPPPDTLDIIKSSLQKLAKTYENFFSLSELAQKLIPLGHKP